MHTVFWPGGFRELLQFSPTVINKILVTMAGVPQKYLVRCAVPSCRPDKRAVSIQPCELSKHDSEII